MEFFRIKGDIPFMRHAKVFNAISVVTFLIAVAFLAFRGLHLSVEFTGGTVMEVAFSQPADLEQARVAIEELNLGEAQVQNFGTSRDVMIRLPLREGVTSDQQAAQVMTALRTVDPAVEQRRNEFVGPQVGKELATDGAMALLVVIAGIMIYLAIRFEWKYAVAAIIANLHDVVIILGFFAAFQWEFSLAVLAAVLAVLGYSVNESVVIFDRVREKFRERRARNMTTPQVLDHAITSTISRTIITHGSTQLMVLSMLLFGGATLFYFALALTIGILFGIYSSVFVAAAIAMWLGVKREDLLKPAKKKEDAGGVELPLILGGKLAGAPGDPGWCGFGSGDLPLRLFHWLLVLCLIGSFATIKAGWMDWHFRFGYTALGLIVFRLMWGVAGPRYARFSSFLNSPRATVAYLRGADDAPRSLGHSPIGALSVFALLSIVLVQAGAGLFVSDDIASEGPLARLVSNAFVDGATRLHRFNERLILGLVGLHVAAILYYRVFKRQSLVKPMVVGDKLLATDPAHPEAASLATRDDLAVRLRAVALAILAAAIVAGIVNWPLF